MSTGVNSITLIGRMTRDPENGVTPSGIAYSKFGLAVDRPVKAVEGEQKPVDFFDVICWRGQAEFVAQYAGKGRLVFVSGPHQSRSYVAQDGSNRKVWEVDANRIQLLDRAPDAYAEEGTDSSGLSAPTAPAYAAQPAPRQPVAAGNGAAPRPPAPRPAPSRPPAPPIDPLAGYMDD